MTAESIIRHGPGIIISFYRPGVDSQKAFNFFNAKSENSKAIIGGNLLTGENTTPCHCRCNTDKEAPF